MILIKNNQQKKKASSYLTKDQEVIGYATEPKKPGDPGYMSNQTMWLRLFVRTKNDPSSPITTLRVSSKKTGLWAE